MVICDKCSKIFNNTKQLRGHAIIHKRINFSGKNHPMYGKSHSEETKLKISNSLLGFKHTDETKKKLSIISSKRKGEKRTDKTKQKMRENHVDFSGKNHPFYGKKHTEESKKKMSEAKKGQIPWNKGLIGVQCGSNAPNWQGGKSFEPYGMKFNKEFKQFILERDSHKCQNPDCIIENPKQLQVHHIDYDKQNNNSDNLIILCCSCHMKSNFNRDYWINYYNEIMRLIIC